MESLLDFLRSMELKELVDKAKTQGEWGPVWKYLLTWGGGKVSANEKKARSPMVAHQRPAWETKIYTDLLSNLEHATPDQRERIIDSALRDAEQHRQHAQENHEQQHSHQKQGNVREWIKSVVGVAGLLVSSTVVVMGYLKGKK